MTSIFRPLAALALGAVALLAAACSDNGGGASATPKVPITPVLTDVVMGSATAPVTLIEYASFSCSHCRDFWKQDFPRLKANYIDTGKVKYIYRDYPTDPKLAVMLVSISRCKGADVYYDMVEDIFTNQVEIYEASSRGQAWPLFAAMGQRHGISEAELQTCLEHKPIAEALTKSIAEAQTRGVANTPSVYLNDVFQEDHSYPVLSAALDKLLGVAPAPGAVPAPATEAPAQPAQPAKPTEGAPASAPSR